MCDDDATSELRVKTVKYFKGLVETSTLIERPMEGYSGALLQGRSPGASPSLSAATAFSHIHIGTGVGGVTPASLGAPASSAAGSGSA